LPSPPCAPLSPLSVGSFPVVKDCDITVFSVVPAALDVVGFTVVLSVLCVEDEFVGSEVNRGISPSVGVTCGAVVLEGTTFLQLPSLTHVCDVVLLVPDCLSVVSLDDSVVLPTSEVGGSVVLSLFGVLGNLVSWLAVWGEEEMGVVGYSISFF
jgi:hypothetical protein